MMSTETEVIASLRTMAGVRTGSELTVPGEVPVRVRHFGGSSAHVVLDTPYLGRPGHDGGGYRGSTFRAPRPMQIAMRLEVASDGRAKRAGIAVEAQTGDAEFDALVFIDSPSEHAVTRTVLASPEARRAIIALLNGGASEVTLDGVHGQVTALVQEFRKVRSAAALVESLRLLAANVPQVEKSGEAPRDPWLGLAVLLGAGAVVGCIVAVVTMFAVLPGYCYSSSGDGTSLSCTVAACCAPAQSGGGVGAAVGLIAGLVMARRVRGTSGAHRQRFWVGLFTFLVILEISVVLSHLVGAVALRLP